MSILKKGLFVGLVLITIRVSGQNAPTGLLWDDLEYQQLPVAPLSDKSTKIERVSYQQFLPSVLNQGAYLTCVGFACAYYLQTAVEAKLRQIQDKETINKIALSPVYLYQKVKSPNDVNCKEGISLRKGLDYLKNQPVLSFRDFPYTDCTPKAPASKQLNPFQIADYQRLFDVDALKKDKVQKLKDALSLGFPVVIGLSTPPTFLNLKKKEWTPALVELAHPHQYDGHALCIVGYDNTYLGGAFQIVNSFGTNWGERGLCWIKYETLASFVRYGYKITPRIIQKKASSGLSSNSIFQLKLLDATQKEIPLEYDGNSQNNTFFKSASLSEKISLKIMAQTDKPIFLYLWACDEDGKKERMLPASDDDPAILFQNFTNLFNNSSLTLFDTSRKEFLFFAVSETKLDNQVLGNIMRWKNPAELLKLQTGDSDNASSVSFNKNSGIIQFRLPTSGQYIVWGITLEL